MKNAAILLAILSFSAQGARLKDISDLKGARSNDIMGYGLVVGLNGSGDTKLDATAKSLGQMFKQMGVESPDSVVSKNVAAVIVTATLQPFSRVGTKVDVIVSSVGDAKSLMGGTLLLTPLKGGDQNIYAVAQGPLIVGGLSAGSTTKNHPTVGRIPSGASIEREIKVDFDALKSLRLSLHHPDFTTAARVTKVVNMELGGKYVTPRDSRTIDIIVPFQYENRVVELISLIENLDVTTDASARVVINERTGTVVMGEQVKLEPCSVSHGNLTITIESDDSGKKKGKAAEQTAALIEMPRATQIKDVVRALNRLGVTPRDLVDILQSMKASGALQANLEVM